MLAVSSRAQPLALLFFLIGCSSVTGDSSVLPPSGQLLDCTTTIPTNSTAACPPSVLPPATLLKSGERSLGRKTVTYGGSYSGRSESRSDNGLVGRREVRSSSPSVNDEPPCSDQNQGKLEADGSWQRPSLVCLPASAPLQAGAPSQPLEVYIRTLNNRTQFEEGTAVTIECRFATTTLDQDLKFKLKWLRSVVGSPLVNQSIAATAPLTNDAADADIDSSVPLTTEAPVARVWTVQRSGGLDLELNNFQSHDGGSYFCQAVDPDTDSILSEAQIKLSSIEQPLTTTIDQQQQQHRQPAVVVTASNGDGDRRTPAAETSGQATKSEHRDDEDDNETDTPLAPHNLYSQENLAKLLPSLKVFPSFSEVALGDTVQLACLTSELDPDPEPGEIEWTFELVESRSKLLLRPPIASSNLPPNVSVVGGNMLVVWSMADDHAGLYKCTVRLPEFNLSAQAVGELATRPTVDSAPLVSVSPELIRLSPNGSATIQCVATGYPPPELTWYRVDSLSLAPAAQPKSATTATNDSSSSSSSSSSNHRRLMQPQQSLDIDEGIGIESVAYKDSATYCEHHRPKCSFQSSNTRRATQVTGVSLVHLHGAQAKHQGQYVCRADNKHGSNQASSVVDVEFKEPPVVSIADQFREQTIVLPPTDISNLTESQLNVTFKCTIESGRPQPRLRWLRTSASSGSNLNVDNLDIYDLTKVSSATSNVRTWPEDNGRSLVLAVSTISLDDEGDYVCVGENEWARHSAVARLTVRRPVSVRILQSSPLLARLNESFHLDCLASGHPVPLDIEWSRSDKGAFFSLISHSQSNLHGGQERAVLKFDRVSQEESGEYTCNARDPLDPKRVLRDTIMVLVEDVERSGERNLSSIRLRDSLLPKLMVRPTKASVALGSNVTLDCLTVSGLQPTIVEWIAPPFKHMDQETTANSDSSSVADSNNTYSRGASFNIRPYYRGGSTSGQLFQFGSKLKILNVTKAHEGVYQCKGRNRVGVENAPALIKVIDWDAEATSDADAANQVSAASGASSVPSATGSSSVTKTKVAKVGSNIELKCQVAGIEQPATSWSRDGLELPASSVQIEHNLWIQNVSSNDNGLYICSARAKQPNKVIQAKINLLVRGELEAGSRWANLSAKIIASKSQLNIGDSVTLECIVSQQQASNSTTAAGASLKSAPGLEEIERQVVWTNLHSGQSLFQDNVYTQNNLLIIYDLRPENSATYRCNYNDLAQHTDYKLQVDAAGDNSTTTDAAARAKEAGGMAALGVDQTSVAVGNNVTTAYLTSTNGQRAELKQAPLGSRLVVECPWQHLVTSATERGQHHHYYYWLRGNHENRRPVGQESRPLVFDSIQTEDGDIYHCHLMATKGVNVSMTATHQQSQLHSVLVNVLVPIARFAQKPVSFITLPTISGADHQLDIELKFLPERDNGLILFNGQQQSSQLSNGGNISGINRTTNANGGDYVSLGLNRGHLEFRFELGDGTTLLRSLNPVALGQWHKVVIERNRRGAVMWLDKQPPVSNSSAGKFFNLNLDSVLYVGGNQYFLNGNKRASGRFYGYARGFQGCISWLRISRNEINLMARNRSVAVGIYECDKSECTPNECGQPNGVCQVTRRWPSGRRNTTGSASLLDATTSFADFRCVCLPGVVGDLCDRQVPESAEQLASLTTSSPTITTTIAATRVHQHQLEPTSAPASACELLKPCASEGTLQCQSLTSASFKCHCQLGFMGGTCSQVAQFTSDTSVWFNQQAYLQLRFNKAEEAQQALLRQQQTGESNSTTPAAAQQQEGDAFSSFNLTNFVKLTSMTEHQNISFKLRTKSSYGLVFYTGQASLLEPANGGDSVATLGEMGAQSQTSKSMVANLLARLSSNVFDYLAIALVDGHVELSYELGSGVAIIRSSRRVNDGDEHRIQAVRQGKLGRLIIDETQKHEGSSPGKLSMLNSQTGHIHLGGLAELTTNNMHLSGFVGCLSSLEINSLGPLNLIRADHLSQVRAARNLAPCSPAATRKPYQQPASPSSESDDPDEM